MLFNYKYSVSDDNSDITKSLLQNNFVFFFQMKLFQSKLNVSSLRSLLMAPQWFEIKKREPFQEVLLSCTTWRFTEFGSFVDAKWLQSKKTMQQQTVAIIPTKRHRTERRPLSIKFFSSFIFQSES